MSELAAKIKAHYRNAWLGTFAGLLIILLFIGLAFEITFAQSFVGDGQLAWRGTKFGIAVGFLGFLILRDQAKLSSIDRVRGVLLISLLGILLGIWTMNFTNRIGRGEANRGFMTVTLVSKQAVYAKSEQEVSQKPQTRIPAYYKTIVADDTGEQYTFKTRIPLFPEKTAGEKVALPVIHGRWGQDYTTIAR